jgi:phosphonate transport system ATP-binding protein
MLAPRNEDIERTFRLLDRVGIPEKLFERTDRLSGGQQQRVALARALFQEPASLLADEPVASVDPTRARDLIQLMINVSAEDKLTLVAALHDLSIAREFFPRCVGMRAGCIVFDQPTADVTPEAWDDLYRLESTGDE